MVICYLILRHQSGQTALQANPLRNLCVRRLPRLSRPCRGLGRGVPPRSLLTFNFELLTSSSSIFQPLDFSSLGLTLNFQLEVTKISRSKIPGGSGPEIPTRSGLSTFNRVSFPSSSSPHLCVLCGENSSPFRSSVIPRHSPLTTNSFIIRTSKTPLPQPLYNPHLRARLGSAGNKGLITPLESALTSTAGNKGLITPLESALTKNSPVTRLESALTKRWGVGGPSCHSGIRHTPLVTTHYVQVLSFQTIPHSFALSCACQELNSFVFRQFRTLCEKHPGVGEGCNGIPKQKL